MDPYPPPFARPAHSLTNPASHPCRPPSLLSSRRTSSLLMQLAVVLACFSLSLNVFSVYYNYFDFRYHWSPLDISLYFSTFGILLALTSGLFIRFLVPKRLSVGRGVLLGLALQVRWFTTHSSGMRAPVLLGTAPLV